jgi:membrane-associated phospholipid phosphatase
MEGISNLGVEVILYLQGLGEWLIGPMKFFTFLGNEEFYLFVAPIFLWCIDMKLGLRLGLRLMISGSINSIFKLAFRGPRPYWYDKRVVAHAAEGSFGVPSGHSQNAVVVWGTIAQWIGRAWGWIAAILIIFIIGLSRMALGVHFLHDVLLGWSIGALLLWVLSRLEAPTLAWIKRYSSTNQMLIAFGASLVLILIGAIIRMALGSWHVPAEWQQLASAAHPGAEPIDPLALSGLISNAAVFFGLAVGAIWLEMGRGFDATGPIWQRSVRFVLGVLGVFLIWYGLGAIFPRGEYLLAYILRYLRYALIGLWVSALAPLIFIRIKLAQPIRD